MSGVPYAHERHGVDEARELRILPQLVRLVKPSLAHGAVVDNEQCRGHPGVGALPEAHHIIVEGGQAHRVLDPGHTVHDLGEVHLRVGGRLGQHVEPQLACRRGHQVPPLPCRLGVVLDGDGTVVAVPAELLACVVECLDGAEHAQAAPVPAAVDDRTRGQEARSRHLAGTDHVGHPAVAVLVAVDLDHGGDAVCDGSADVPGRLFGHVQRGVIDVGMRVGVHQPGDDGRAAHIVEACGGRNLDIGADGRDAGPVDQHGGVFEHGPGGVHRHDAGAGQRHHPIRTVDVVLDRELGAACRRARDPCSRPLGRAGLDPSAPGAVDDLVHRLFVEAGTAGPSQGLPVTGPHHVAAVLGIDPVGAALPLVRRHGDRRVPGFEPRDEAAVILAQRDPLQVRGHNGGHRMGEHVEKLFAGSVLADALEDQHPVLELGEMDRPALGPEDDRRRNLSGDVGILQRLAFDTGQASFTVRALEHQFEPGLVRQPSSLVQAACPAHERDFSPVG